MEITKLHEIDLASADYDIPHRDPANGLLRPLNIHMVLQPSAEDDAVNDAECPLEIEILDGKSKLQVAQGCRSLTAPLGERGGVVVGLIDILQLVPFDEFGGGYRAHLVGWLSSLDGCEWCLGRVSMLALG